LLRSDNETVGRRRNVFGGCCWKRHGGGTWAAILLALALALPQDAHASEESAADIGHDSERPPIQLDIRYRYLDRPPEDNDNRHSLILRAERPFLLDSDSKLSLRIDLPVVYTDAISGENEEGRLDFGMGDILLQALYLQQEGDRFSWRAGTKVILPTATKEPMGSGKYRLVPTVGARYSFPEIGEGSSFLALIAYDVDVAGDDDRPHISELQFEPTFSVNLSDGWFMTLYPSSDIRYNFAHIRSSDSGRWFVPIDGLVGRKFSNGTIWSIELGAPIINDYSVYDFKLETRFSVVL
jgi:hypothetical protein